MGRLACISTQCEANAHLFRPHLTQCYMTGSYVKYICSACIQPWTLKLINILCLPCLINKRWDKLWKIPCLGLNVTFHSISTLIWTSIHSISLNHSVEMNLCLFSHFNLFGFFAIYYFILSHKQYLIMDETKRHHMELQCWAVGKVKFRVSECSVQVRGRGMGTHRHRHTKRHTLWLYEINFEAAWEVTISWSC